ncbi:MAG: XRE family transcriptional regulator, partial [Acidimicrobiales bacterium]
HSALGDLADVTGWMAVDANAKQEASQVFSFALGCAEKAEDWSLRGQVLSSMAQLAVRNGQPDDGLTLAEHALVRADRLTATSQAVLHTVRGRALAKMHRTNETLTAVGTADDHFAHSTPANDPPCMAFYNDARHAQFAGRPLADLAILGHNTAQEAADRLTTAAAGHAVNNNTCSRAVCLAMLASLTMSTGDPLQAATIGHEALDAADTLRSRQLTDELRELARHAAAHQNLDEVAHLRHRIATLLVRTDNP